MAKCPENGRWFQKIFMIFKFLWWFLNSCAFKNHFWNHKNLGHAMPAGAVGAVRPVGAILPTATAAGPIPLTKPRTATPLRRPLPASHDQMMNYFCAWPCQYDIDQNKKMPHDTAANYDVSRKRDYTCGTSQHGSCETFMSYGQEPFDFRPSWQRQSCITYWQSES